MTKFIWITEMCDPVTYWVPIVEKINNGSPIILYTKALVPLDVLSINRKNFAICYTITGWGGTWLEPFVPDPSSLIKHINGAASMLGDRLTIRVDPVIPTEEGFKRALDAIGSINRPVKIISSILQLYQGHDKMAKKLSINPLDYSITSGRAKFVKKEIAQDWIDTVTSKYSWTKGRLQMCGMPYDLKGITHTGCIDKQMLDSIGVYDYETIPEGKQRPGCKCIINKKQLVMGACAHGCAYCYAHKENLKNVF